MIYFLHFLLLLPLLGFLAGLLLPEKKEKLISRFVANVIGSHLLACWVFCAYWLLTGASPLNQKDIALFQTEHYEFFIDFYFDKVSAVYLLVGSFLTFLVTVYSRVYLHREKGYKRFFNTLLFFYLGYNSILFSGNFETLFIGWEILGISSFLLISFYRDRYLPVKNAVKVFSIYRVGDVGLLLATWMSHHLWHENITFLKLHNAQLVHEHLESHSLVGIFISLMILLSAAAKSAQLPFSSWLPRAMEGPTPSSAIFYGSLSVHMGVFLLIRTFPFWEEQTSVRILIGIVGLLTSLVCSGIARVQSSVKSQIGYASIAQIGLIFIEVALGWENLALFHFAGNAFLRTYQLLVSPSIVSYLIREQFYHFVPRQHSLEDSLPKKLEYSLYLLCLKEWNLDSMMYRYLWNPLKWMGKQLSFLSPATLTWIMFPALTLGGLCLYWEAQLPPAVVHSLPGAFSVIGLVLVLKAFTERRRVRLGWVLILLNHCWIALAISFNEHFDISHLLLYLSGVSISSLLGYACLQALKRQVGNIDLDRFQGHAFAHPKIAFVFLLSCLGLTGFPITPTFIGEDLIFSHIHEDQFLLAASVSLSFILDGLAAIRIFARVFMGAPLKRYHEIAYRSS
jgi:NADH-quinone oxidoreductase subunit L